MKLWHVLVVSITLVTACYSALPAHVAFPDECTNYIYKPREGQVIVGKELCHYPEQNPTSNGHLVLCACPVGEAF